MEYGLARKFEVYDFDGQKAEAVIARPSAWFEAALWEDAHADGLPDTVKGTYGVYVWGYFALKQAGLLGKYGLPDELDYDGVVAMMGRLAVTVSTMGDEDAPLAARRAE